MTARLALVCAVARGGAANPALHAGMDQVSLGVGLGFWYSCHPMLHHLRIVFLAIIALSTVVQAIAADYPANIASLIEPAKLATLKARGANPRIQKCVYWLEAARLAGNNPTNTAHTAVSKAGYRSVAAVLTEQSLLRNLDIASKLGCLDKEGLAKMRRGGSPTVNNGPYAGDVASVDHIIPRSVVQELDCVVANLELLPLRVNKSKNSTVGARQRDLAKKLHKAGLLSEAGLNAVLIR